MSEFKNHGCMAAGATIPQKESVESSLEHRPRVTPGAVAEDLTPELTKHEGKTQGCRFF